MAPLHSIIVGSIFTLFLLASYKDSHKSSSTMTDWSAFMTVHYLSARHTYSKLIIWIKLILPLTAKKKPRGFKRILRPGVFHSCLCPDPDVSAKQPRAADANGKWFWFSPVPTVLFINRLPINANRKHICKICTYFFLFLTAFKQYLFSLCKTRAILGVHRKLPSAKDSGIKAAPCRITSCAKNTLLLLISNYPLVIRWKLSGWCNRWSLFLSIGGLSWDSFNINASRYSEIRRILLLSNVLLFWDTNDWIWALYRGLRHPSECAEHRWPLFPKRRGMNSLNLFQKKEELPIKPGRRRTSRGVLEVRADECRPTSKGLLICSLRSLPLFSLVFLLGSRFPSTRCE